MRAFRGDVFEEVLSGFESGIWLILIRGWLRQDVHFVQEFEFLCEVPMARGTKPDVLETLS